MHLLEKIWKTNEIKIQICLQVIALNNSAEITSHIYKRWKPWQIPSGVTQKKVQRLNSSTLSPTNFTESTPQCWEYLYGRENGLGEACCSHRFPSQKWVGIQGNQRWTLYHLSPLVLGIAACTNSSGTADSLKMRFKAVNSLRTNRFPFH